MDQQVQPGQVVIYLSVIDSDSNFAVPERRIVLSKERPTITIGRSSKRDSSLGASEHNGWIDSPVMSRDHAQLRFDAENQVVSLTDIGSLHGTFYNGSEEPIKASQELKHGDTVAFGVRIERGPTSFHQCQMHVGLEFGEKVSSNGPMVFQVPDDTDVESVIEALETEEDRSIKEAMDVVEEHGIAPAQKVDYIQSSDPIDLTVQDWDSPIDLEQESSQSTPPTSPPDKILGYVEAEVDADDENCVSNEADEADLFGSDLEDEDTSASNAFAPAEFATTGVPFEGTSLAGVAEGVEPDPNENIEITEEAPAATDPTLSKVDQILQQVDLERISRMREERVRCLTKASIAFMQSKQAEEASQSAPTQSSVPTKRKASEISQGPPPGNRTISEDISEAPRASPTLENADRSSKRLRRVAEAVGFAALGGIAVVTALIATAPAL